MIMDILHTVKILEVSTVVLIIDIFINYLDKKINKH